MRIGYASTSGCGTKGWFCVTNFRLAYLGEEASAEEASQVRRVLSERISDAGAALPSARLAADKMRLQAAMDEAQAVVDNDAANLQTLNAALSSLETALADVAASNAALAAYDQALADAETLQASLKSEDAVKAQQDLMTAQKGQIDAEEATAETVNLCATLLRASTAYFTVLDEAAAYASNEEYAEDERAALQQTMDKQITLLPLVADETAFSDLIRELEEAMLLVRKTQLPGDNSDYTFAILSPDLETFGANGDPLGWELNVTNGDGKVKTGQHYSGNTGNHYFDSYCNTRTDRGILITLYYTGRQIVTGIPNGTYTLQCAARTSGEGAFITARTATQDLKKEITKYGVEGNDAGPIWENAAAGSAEKNANGGKGFGWQTIEITDIVVTDNRLDIGFTNDSFVTGKEWTGTWFSADDFRLFYVSDRTTGMETALAAQGALRVIGGKGCIQVYADAPYTVYNLSGMAVNRTQGLAPGIYLVKCGKEVRKVQVK